MARRRRRIAVSCKTTPSGAKVCRTRPSKTKVNQRLVKAIRAIDKNAELQGITHKTRELRSLLNYLVKDA